MVYVLNSSPNVINPTNYLSFNIDAKCIFTAQFLRISTQKPLACILCPPPIQFNLVKFFDFSRTTTSLDDPDERGVRFKINALHVKFYRPPITSKMGA